MSADDAILDMIEPALGAGWVSQFGRWEEDAGSVSVGSATARKRYAVLRPAGGGRAELVRTPQYTLSLIGIDGGDLEETKAAANRVVELLRASAGRLVFLQTGEPSYMPTIDGRPVFELAVSAITT